MKDILVQNMKKVIAAALLMGMAASSWADWETCNYRGEALPDGGTKVINDRQASKTWDDWVWRGKQDNRVQYCSPNSKECTFGWTGSKTTSYSHTVGWSVGGGFGFPIKAIGIEIEGQYQRSKTWTQSQTESFDERTTFAPGKWAQPVIVAVRRWRTGHFNGAHFLQEFANGTPVPGKKWGCYVYDWSWRNFGSWSGNEKDWGYHMIQVVNDRRNL